MKNKIIKLSAFFLLLFLLIPSQTFAYSDNDDFEIESYNIDMIVNEDNTFDITETLSVNFLKRRKDGIYKEIPLYENYKKLNEIVPVNKIKITNIRATEKVTSSKKSGYEIIKIGDPRKTVYGKKTYTLSYTYNIGKDQINNKDELYYNLIGKNWNCDISNVSFKITMPKSFDKTALNFSVGFSDTSWDNSKITYNITENIIKGSVNSGLIDGEDVTVRLTLPEGYFASAKDNIDYITVFKIMVSIAFIIKAFIIWNKYGKDKMVVDAVEFYPPNNINSIDMEFLNKGFISEYDLFQLIKDLEKEGYLKIEKQEPKILKFAKNINLKIVKLKEYDGNDTYKKQVFRDLFNSGKNEVTIYEMYEKFSNILSNIAKGVNRSKNTAKVYDPISLQKSILILIMVIVEFIFMHRILCYRNILDIYCVHIIFNNISISFDIFRI